MWFLVTGPGPVEVPGHSAPSEDASVPATQLHSAW